ncbi:hypothetical protein IFM60648_01339 [Aspergillus lentulus]|uniref:Fe2OG dioxygenase domain-containing protein n=1 Tax=Aspergillus lentulus TaxID=293939 RepID=A0ABQ0ZU78_ASPLE|nr:hypothetical protein IFM60648_01339 [Aspergillus lentulus]
MSPSRPARASAPKPKSVKTGRIRKVRSTVSPISVAPQVVTANGATEPATEPVDGQPPAWAECRPELCDALPWFRAVQGGSYHCDHLCWGFLLDADCGIRSYIDEEVVFTRVGGGCTKDAEGNLILVRDQGSDDSAVSSLINSMNLKVPVGLIIGDRNTLLGRKLPHRYNVMDYFRVTDVWYERIGGKVGAKVRFEKLDLSTKSWWAAKDSAAPVPYHQRPEIQAEINHCAACHTASPRIYNEGWMCLEPTCDSFWTINGFKPPLDFTFHRNFIHARTPPAPEVVPHHDLVPNLLPTLEEDGEGVSYSRIAWKGIVCPRCQKCISRKYWRGWKCTDELSQISRKGETSCTFEKMLTVQPVSLRSVIDDFGLGPNKRACHFDPKFAVPDIDDETLFPYRKLTYRIPGVGSITHFVANRIINSRSGGPNDLFRQLQVADFGLRRYPLQQSVVAGTLTAHFAVNYGMPYKYIVSVGSRPFADAPDEILQALGRLTWATERAVAGSGDTFLPPNELLMLGYFEDMKIGYHDDGESSLGPTIATLSLGAKSVMSIRMKYKYYNGLSKAKTLLKDDPVLAGCRMEAERRSLKSQLANSEIDQITYNSLRRKALQKGKCGEAPVEIKMELNHGDLVVMHGENLQKYYEHAVTPDKKLRFALTARYIKPDHVEPEHLPKGEFILTPDQIYDGK